jgi:hypothetical protein
MQSVLLAMLLNKPQIQILFHFFCHETWSLKTAQEAWIEVILEWNTEQNICIKQTTRN